MSIDMSQFHQVFFEESFEGLDIMETGLMDLDLGAADSEEINTIFRAAHSIKGGAGTFGFTDVASFTHVMETLLDEMRDGTREVTRKAVDLLLVSVDCLREMLSAVDAGEDIDQDRKGKLQNDLEAMLAEGSDTTSSVSEAEASTESQTSGGVWKISFTPHSHLFKTGNDPVRMFRELEHLGELSTTVDASKLPTIEDLDPEEAYMSWSITLKSDCSEADIMEIFEWVDEDCDLAVTQESVETEAVADSPVVAEASIDEVTEQAPVAEKSPAKEEQASTEKKTPAKKKASKATSNESSSIRVWYG